MHKKERNHFIRYILSFLTFCFKPIVVENGNKNLKETYKNEK